MELPGQALRLETIGLARPWPEIEHSLAGILAGDASGAPGGE